MRNYHAAPVSYGGLRRAQIGRLVAKELPFVPDDVGRAWNPRAEIDVLAVNWKRWSVIVGECKWTRQKMGVAELQSLQERAAKLERIGGFKMQYALFSKSGFTTQIPTEDRKNLLLFQGTDLRRV